MSSRLSRYLGRGFAASALVLALCTAARAQPVAYTDEVAFLTALASRSLVTDQEGFEDGAAWGAVRTTVAGGSQTAPAVTSRGVTWVSSSPANHVTTGAGAARSGEWGIFSLPHGDYDNGITDGLAGTTTEPLVAVGGWFESNTPPAKLALFLDGDTGRQADFGDLGALGHESRFFGVIDAAGFTRFDFREMEGKAEDQKLVFADDFTFAFGGSIVDCNENGVADWQDIAGGTSADCNLNSLPDECEIDAASSAPGGPFFCQAGCAEDCNTNGVPDDCEALSAETYSSGVLSPIGSGSPQGFVIPGPPLTRADAIFEFTAYANLGGGTDHIEVDIDGVSVGAVFGPNGSDCPEGSPDAARLVVPAAIFNDAVTGGGPVVNMVATAEVSADGCDLPTFISLAVTIFVPSELDKDGNGILDDCEPPGPVFLRGDVDGNGLLEITDPVDNLDYQFLGGFEPLCLDAHDFDDNGRLEITDAVNNLAHQFLGDPPPPAPGKDTCGPDPTVDLDRVDLGCDNYPAVACERAR